MPIRAPAGPRLDAPAAHRALLVPPRAADDIDDDTSDGGDTGSEGGTKVLATALFALGRVVACGPKAARRAVGAGIVRHLAMLAHHGDGGARVPAPAPCSLGLSVRRHACIVILTTRAAIAMSAGA